MMLRFDTAKLTPRTVDLGVQEWTVRPTGRVVMVNPTSVNTVEAHESGQATTLRLDDGQVINVVQAFGRVVSDIEEAWAEWIRG
jgi:hypothetical protein